MCIRDRTGLDRRARRGCCRRIRLAGRDDAGLAVNGAAVCACFPSDGQGNGRTAIVTFAIAVCVHMIRVFIGGRLADRAGFGSLVLCFAGA